MPLSVFGHPDRFGTQRRDTRLPTGARADARKPADPQHEDVAAALRLLPARLRADVRHIDAFCRGPDDPGEKSADRDRARQLLDGWRRELGLCYAGEPRHPVFIALRGTIDRHTLPRKPFEELIDAAVEDQTVTRYETWDQLIAYCTRRANPVGRLMLAMLGIDDPLQRRQSDAACTAVQLTRFWQDARRDIAERGRVYLPADIAQQHGLNLSLLAAAAKADAAAAGACGCVGVPTAGISAVLPAYRATLRDLVARTCPLFAQARALWPALPRDARASAKRLMLGGEATLKLIERRRFDTLRARPRLSRMARARLRLSAMNSGTSTHACDG